MRGVVWRGVAHAPTDRDVFHTYHIYVRASAEDNMYTNRENLSNYYLTAMTSMTSKPGVDVCLLF